MNRNWKEDLSYLALAGNKDNYLTNLLAQEGFIGWLEQKAEDPTTGRPYGRKVLYEGADGEVLLVRWAAGMYSAVHDHGVGGGHICFIHGQYDEEFWSWQGNTMKPFSHARRDSGDICTIRAKVAHRVRCHTAGLSLHFYIPGSSGMRIFDFERSQTLLVEDDCGAWIDDTKVIQREKWECD